MKHLFTLIAFVLFSLVARAQSEFTYSILVKLDNSGPTPQLRILTFRCLLDNDEVTIIGIRKTDDAPSYPYSFLHIPTVATRSANDSKYPVTKVVFDYSDGDTYYYSINEFLEKYNNQIVQLDLPNTLTEFSRKGLSTNTGINHFAFYEDNQYNVDFPIYYSNESAIFTNTADGKELVAFPPAKSFEGYAFPKDIVYIGENAFAGCPGQILDLSKATSLYRIKDEAFYGCPELKKIWFPYSLTYLEQACFAHCKELNEIHIASWRMLQLPVTYSNYERHAFYDTNSGSGTLYAVNLPYTYKDFQSEWGSWGVKNTEPFVLTDGEEYIVNEYVDFYDGIGAQYSRNFTKANAWNALYLPFSVAGKTDDYEIAEILTLSPVEDTNGDGVTDIKDDHFLVVTRLAETDVTKPNKPYLVRPKQAGVCVFDAADKYMYAAPATPGTVSCSTTKCEYKVSGIYSNVQANADNKFYYMGADGSISRRTDDGSTTIKPYRWYFEAIAKDAYASNSEPAQAKISVFVLGEDEGDATAIANILNNKNANSDTYSLDGRKVSNENLLPGIYVRNGKKIFVK